MLGGRGQGTLIQGDVLHRLAAAFRGRTVCRGHNLPLADFTSIGFFSIHPVFLLQELPIILKLLMPFLGHNADKPECALPGISELMLGPGRNIGITTGLQRVLMSVHEKGSRAV